MSIEFSNFGNGIKNARKKHGLKTQQQLVYALTDYGFPTTLATVRNWEQGKSYPEASTLEVLCKFFDCDMDYLFGRIDCKKHDVQFISDYTGLDEEVINVLSIYQKTDATQMLKAINALIAAEATYNGHSPLQTMAAYLFFGKQKEYICKISDRGEIVTKKLSPLGESNIANDFLVDYFYGTIKPLLIIDDETLFDEALYNTMCQAMRNFKAELRQKEEKN